MSHEDTNCPCGGKKERETMLCPLCLAACMEDPNLNFELARYRDGTRSFESRRSSAIALLSASRRRRRFAGHSEGYSGQGFEVKGI